MQAMARMNHNEKREIDMMQEKGDSMIPIPDGVEIRVVILTIMEGAIRSLHAENKIKEATDVGFTLNLITMTDLLPEILLTPLVAMGDDMEKRLLSMEKTYPEQEEDNKSFSDGMRILRSLQINPSLN